MQCVSACDRDGLINEPVNHIMLTSLKWKGNLQGQIEIKDQLSGSHYSLDWTTGLTFEVKYKPQFFPPS
jgi:hypothetical protein